MDRRASNSIWTENIEEQRINLSFMTAPHYRGKKITLLIGDLILIILSTYLAVYIRLFKYFNVLDYYTGSKF